MKKLRKVICTVKTWNRHYPVLVEYSKIGDTAYIACKNCMHVIVNEPKHVNMHGEVIA